MPKKLEFKEVELREGLTLLHHRSGKWKTEVFRMFLAAPIAQNVAERSLAAYLLRHGHEKLRGMDAVSRRMQDLFGANISTFVSKTSDRHLLAMRGNAVAADLVPGKADPLASLFEYLNEILSKPWFADKRFAADDFERERANLLRSIDSIKDSKSQYAEQRLIEEMFRGHPFARPAFGFRTEVEKADRDDVVTEFRRLTVEAPMLLYVVSPRSTRELASLLKKTLEFGARPGLRGARVKAPEIRKRSARFSETDGVVQGRLAMGYRFENYRRSRDVHAAVLADMLFGGSSSSHLFKEIREKRSLAYSIQSNFDAGSGSVLVSAGVDPIQVREVERLVKKEQKALAAGKFERAELDTVLVTIKKQLEGMADSPDALISFHSSRKLGQRKETDPAEVYAKYKKVSPQRIADQAGRLVLDTVFTLGPKEHKR